VKFTLSWLRDYLETEASPSEIADTLTMVGLEVERVVDRAAELAPFTVAHVLEVKPHPNADRLRLCKVDTGSGTLEVVCGAPNARSGMKAVLARVGAVIPDSGEALKKSKIRGVESEGMLCSAAELLTGDDQDGIIDLPEDAPVGGPFAAVLGLDDPVFDMAVTPNRGDCLGVRGIARELAAAGLGRLREPETKTVAGEFACPVAVSFAFPEDAVPSPCDMFAGRVIKGVANGPSPRWMQNRLRAIGLRPISALVDATNYLAFDLGRPFHVFDAGKLKGDLTVRLSHPGEKLLALNGREYDLDAGMTVVADRDGVLSLAGIMGGEASGCTEATANLFLECALFDPVRTAATGRALSIESESRYRFERGVDPASVLPGIEEATAMIVELCGGTASEIVVEGREPDWRRVIALRPARVHQLGGLDLPETRTKLLLEGLGCMMTVVDGVFQVSVPSWRRDLEIEADLIEEVLRLTGLEKIVPESLPREGGLPKPALTPAQRRAGRVRRTLAGRGMVEAVTWSFLADKDARLFDGGNPRLRLVNPISADLDMMRPSALPNLVAAAGRNAARGFTDAALFEIGPVYTEDDQASVAAGIRAGSSGPRNWAPPPRAVDAFDAKADVLAALGAADVPLESLQIVREAPDYYHPGRSGAVLLADKTMIARFGELHPKVLAGLDVAGPVAAFEIFLDAIPEPKKKRGRALLRPSPYQAVERDFAFVVNNEVTSESIVRAAVAADRALISNVSVFDLYSGKGVAAGKKSLAITVRLEPADRTLTDEEIEAVTRRIVANVEKATGGTLRT
jgi:phenylalanyl-tRNA synthetase beta chain